MGILQQVAWRAIEEHESNLQFSLLMAKQVGQFVARELEAIAGPTSGGTRTQLQNHGPIWPHGHHGLHAEKKMIKSAMAKGNFHQFSMFTYVY